MYTWAYETPMNAGESSILEPTPVETLLVFMFTQLNHQAFHTLYILLSGGDLLDAKFLIPSSVSAALEAMSGLSYGLASCSYRALKRKALSQWIQCFALASTCQFLSDFSTSNPTFIPMSSVYFHFSFYKNKQHQHQQVTYWQWDFGQIT